VSPEQIAAFLTFSVVAAITPGPGNILLTATGAAVGVWRGTGCLFGVSAGMASLMFAVALGLGSLILQYPLLLDVMKWAGAAFLLWLAWKIATAEVADQSDAPKPVGFLEAALLQWINPKAWVVTTGAVGTYFPADANGVFIQALALAGLFVVAALPCVAVLRCDDATLSVDTARRTCVQYRDGGAAGSKHRPRLHRQRIDTIEHAKPLFAPREACDDGVYRAETERR
jgi:threonine/homoserine/homoserine lactone efflux protein